MKNIDIHIKNKEFFNIYLIFGNEEFLKKEYENKLISSIVLEQTKLMNFNYFEGKDIQIEEVINTCETLPFMAENRLVILKNSGIFSDIQKGKELIKYIENIPKSTILVFFEKNVNKRLKIFKNVKKVGYVAEINHLKENELLKWILQIFKGKSKKIDNSTAIYLIRYVGAEMENLFNEVNKLLDYKHLDKVITKKDINNICTKSLDTTVFELVDAIGRKDLVSAMNLYNNLIFNKVSPFNILAMISRQFRLILQVKYLEKSGLSTYEISKELSILEFLVKDILKQGKNFSNKVLISAIEDCLNTDLNIKTGKIKDVLAVEILIVKYSS